MKQYESVIKAMEQNGGFATLAKLYQNVDISGWKTKTPFASIRRIVQDKRFFFNIKPGLWALNTYRKKLSNVMPLDQSSTKEEKDNFNHSYYQGLIVELGNLTGFQTFVPNQDKNKKYLTAKLDDFTTIKSIYNFTYDYIIDRAKTVDVIWFNEENFPARLFEVEHSTDFHNSFLKMLNLKYFRAEFTIVADLKRQREYDRKLSDPAFIKLKEAGIKFISYEKIAEWHSKAFEYFKVKRELNI